MPILSLEQIKQMDNFSLIAIIDLWNDFEAKAVLLAYAELSQRNFSLTENQQITFNAFLKKNNYTDIDALLKTCLKELKSCDENLKNEKTKKKVYENSEIRKKAMPLNNNYNNSSKLNFLSWGLQGGFWFGGKKGELFGSVGCVCLYLTFNFFNMKNVVFPEKQVGLVILFAILSIASFSIGYSIYSSDFKK